MAPNVDDPKRQPYRFVEGESIRIHRRHYVSHAAYRVAPCQHSLGRRIERRGRCWAYKAIAPLIFEGKACAYVIAF
ncbi:uncharacterized protein G2W53_038159 [Senna tora]|uniref:Uncharacterized protein n=1 Tax=Senna tora TaxID=362788 RepID=A0A834W1V1_9FABA|nr:uncharacterized protein G2W53_038159 [Senna tora]